MGEWCVVDVLHRQPREISRFLLWCCRRCRVIIGRDAMSTGKYLPNFRRVGDQVVKNA